MISNVRSVFSFISILPMHLVRVGIYGVCFVHKAMWLFAYMVSSVESITDHAYLIYNDWSFYCISSNMQGVLQWVRLPTALWCVLATTSYAFLLKFSY